MGFPSKLLSRNIRTLAGTSLTTSFQNVGVVTTIVGYKIAFVNTTTTDIQITDGSASDPWYIPANSSLSIGEGGSTYAAQLDRTGSTPKNCQFQAKLPSGSAPLSGILVITVEGN